MKVSALLASAALGCALTCAACTSSSGGTGAAGGTLHSSSTGVSTPAVSTSPVSSGAASSGGVSSGGAASTSASRSSSRPSSWCVDGEITSAATANPEGAAAGHNSVVLTFTNSSTRTCVLYGYPGADALNSGGTVVAHAKRQLTGYIGGTYSGLTNVTLHPGQVASTILEGDIGDGSAACTAGASVVVTAPNLFHSTPLSGAPYVCDFVIHPVVAGSTGR